VLLVEAARQALGRALVHPLLAEDGALRVITLDPGMEEELTRAFSAPAMAGNPGLKPSFIQDVLLSLKKLIGEQVRMATPVLFCSTPARFHLRRLLEPFLPKVVVLSPGEIPPVVQVHSLGTIR
jgi:flagellar biosynthesis protein FlhA